MDNKNDRYRLILLLHKNNKSLCDKYHIRKLEKRYPDNKSYQGDILSDLTERGLIESVNTEGYQDKNGNWVNIHPKETHYQRTTKEGVTGLKSGLFPSESREKARNKGFRYAEIIGICIAAIGGLITLLSFLYDKIKCFLDQ